MFSRLMRSNKEETNLKLKMADGRIRVSVLEGSFAGLQGVGIPLPVCIHLQDLGLQFEGAQWTAKQSNTGFSISFFWPVQDRSAFGVNRPGKKRRKRRKKDRRTSGWASGSMGRVEAGKEADPGNNNVDDRNTPIEAHCSTGSSPSSPSRGHAAITNQCKVTTDDSKSATSATSTCSLSPPTSGSNNVDLTICSKVQFELRDGVPGVSYQDTENTAGWTPVSGRRRKRPQLPPYVLRRFPPDHPLRRNQSNSDSETDEEICIPQNADTDVCFNILDGVPGLQVTTKNSSKWTPIASRTRSKSKL